MLEFSLRNMLRSSVSRAVPVARKESATAPRWLRPFLLMLGLPLLLCLFTGEVRDTDICWHLKTGQHALETRGLPVPDPFSYTTESGASRYPGEEITRHFNLTHEWLAQIVMYLVYSAAGFPGLVLTRAMLLVLFCGLVGWITFHRTRAFYISLAAALAAAGIAFYFQQSRPFLVTFVFTAATMAILESRRWMWLLPAIFLIWANCHGGFFVGWLVCGAYGCEALIRRLRGKPVPDERRLWLVVAISLLASGLNPNGFRVIQVLSLYRSSGIQTNNLEWQRPMFWQPGMYSFLLFGSLLVLLLAHRRTRPVDWLLFLGFAALSLLAVRNTIFVGLVAPVMMATYLPKWRAVPVIALLLAAATLLIADILPAAKSGNVFALRLAEWQLPSGAADFIQAHQIRDRMFNSYEAGGYLIWRLWPLQRDFIDGRGLSEEAYADYKRILYGNFAGDSGSERLLQKYGIQMLVMEGFDYLSGQVYPLPVELVDSHQAEWKLVHADSKSVTFMRHPARGVDELLNSRERLLESLERQCDEHIRRDPLRPRCAFGLGELYAHRGNVDKAGHWLSYYLERRRGPDPEAEQMYQSLRVTALNNQASSLESKGDFGGAEPLFREALAIAEKSLGPDHPDTAGALNNLATLLEAKGDYDGAEPLFRTALTICEKKLGPADPHTATALDNLAGLLEAKGEDAAAEPLYRRALAIAQKALGPEDPATQTIRDDLDELLKKNTK
jgi:tetratricopeptide (TPR) repeat protein